MRSVDFTCRERADKLLQLFVLILERVARVAFCSRGISESEDLLFYITILTWVRGKNTREFCCRFM